MCAPTPTAETTRVIGPTKTAPQKSLQLGTPVLTHAVYATVPSTVLAKFGLSSDPCWAVPCRDAAGAFGPSPKIRARLNRVAPANRTRDTTWAVVGVHKHIGGGLRDAGAVRGGRVAGVCRSCGACLRRV